MTLLKKVELYSYGRLEAPFNNSEGLINSYIQRVLTELKHEVIPLQNRTHESAFPLSEAIAIGREIRRSKPNARIYSNVSLDLRPATDPDSRIRNAIFFHGLQSHSRIFLRRSYGFHLYAANSQYLHEVLASLLLFPVSLRPLKLINPPSRRGRTVVMPVPLLCPYAVLNAGFEGAGQSIPSELQIKLSEPDLVLGHAIRPKKPDCFATLAILYLLRQLSGRRVKLVVAEEDMPRFESTAREMGMENDAKDLLVASPSLQNKELIELMGRCSFSLCYDSIPESFGLYPLESISQGCPVYSNGVGNLRHLLPEKHGLTVIDSSEMYFGDFQTRILAYGRVAKRILLDIESVDATRKQCARGKRYIEENYSYKSFKTQIKRMMSRLETPASVRLMDPNELRYALSPLVRFWDPKNGNVIADEACFTLNPEQSLLLKTVQGRRVSELKPSAKTERVLLKLFDLGVLSLSDKRAGEFRF